ncbi:hypothetical protein [Rhizobium sp. BK456]|uniref:hypothetical protein n=1 Tax=Rhizobium sp. BK456 TaxID=2587007 RepID=UPI00161AD1C4|nr:hypothetical protein [Rhizobium sp. BK456]MBB3521072.1 hypothetical protein [Rhizobium sp. BK456]
MRRIERICSISDCGKRRHGSRYCRAHYDRLRKYGDPLGGGTFQGEPLRFIHEVALHHVGDDCLTWPFGRNTSGYGQVWNGGKPFVVSRYVCELVHGAPPTPEHEAAHSCGKGSQGCISPGHLSWKTPADNNADRLLHGTHNRGERSGVAKLTEVDVLEIIALKGKETQTKLAKRFGVAIGTIANIHVGRNWAWLSEASKEIGA